MEGLGQLTQVRRQELDGFMIGLLGNAEHIDLPPRAHQAVEELAEMRSIIEGARMLTADPTKTGTTVEIADTIDNIGKLPQIAETEIHEAVVACASARAQLMSMPAAVQTKQ